MKKNNLTSEIKRAFESFKKDFINDQTEVVEKKENLIFPTLSQKQAKHVLLNLIQEPAFKLNIA